MRGSVPVSRAVAALVLAVLAVAACRTTTPPDSATLAALEPELGRLLLVGLHAVDAIEGATDRAELERLLCQTRIGGALLFSRNVVDAAQVARLTGWMRARASACAGQDLLIAVDAEGGRVMRLAPSAGYGETLSAQELGEANDLTVTELEARRIARLLRTAGINWNLAPVVDVGYNPANPLIVGGGRSFSANPLRVIAHARAWIGGMRTEGILTALKHFPGHGSSYEDSHQGFVDVTATANLDVELAPYRALLAERIVDSVMTAHVFNRHLDDRYPATLSHATIEGLLRRDLAFHGLVVTDDLRMAAIERHYGLEAAAVRALAAGADMLLIADDSLPDGRSAAAVALEAIRRALADGRLAPGRVAWALGRVRALQERAAAQP